MSLDGQQDDRGSQFDGTFAHMTEPRSTIVPLEGTTMEHTSHSNESAQSGGSLHQIAPFYHQQMTSLPSTPRKHFGNVKAILPSNIRTPAVTDVDGKNRACPADDKVGKR